MKRLLLFFIALGLLAGTTFAQKTTTSKVQTLVIDPGHGGAKPGAQGKQCWEKDLVLSVALKFGKLVEDNFPDVKVVYTRKTDVDISLAERAHIANRNKADLFISIHANSHTTTTPVGVETFVMGLSQSRANMEVAKKENADILLEADYKDNADYKGFDPNSPESYVMFAMYQNVFMDRSLDFAQFIQDQYKANLRTINRGVKQAELFVLYKTSMPSVLTEIGFISNPDEEAFMLSNEGQAKIAISLLNAFNNYKAQVEQTKPKTNLSIEIPGYSKGKSAAQKQAAAAQAKAEAAANKAIDNTVAQTIADNNGTLDDDVARKAAQDATAAKQKAEAEAQAAAEAATRAEAESRALPIVNYDAPEPAKTVPTTGAEEETPSNKEAGIVEGVTYRVQFLTSDKPLAEGDKSFKGVTGYNMYEQGGLYRYTMGNENTVKKAVSIQGEMRAKGFKDAFVIAFYNGKRISLQEAREMLEEQ